GAAVGGGLTITLSCDYRLASEDSRFGFVFTRRGIYPEGASAWFLPRLVGMGTALDWMISGRVFPAAEALEKGLVHKVFPSGTVLAEAKKLAQEIVETTAPVSVAVTRQLLYRMASAESPFPVHELDSKLIGGLGTNPDAVEGVLSFLQKRPPSFGMRVEKDLPDYLPWLEK
ncbi:enoyl-CoA hydratase-related protein, partial [Amycolatopsis kentuckyensis]|uniref:enoyl-CoA hydratase-related protein n=1 Tax=Amycolatopsis kentuckyensis TaxID=218823 RepID=UPI001ABF0EA2